MSKTQFDYKEAAYRRFANLVENRFSQDDLIERLAAQFVADWLAEHGLDHVRVDSENDQPSYAILDGDPYNDNPDEQLDHAIGWLSKSVFSNPNPPGWNPIVTAADLNIYLAALPPLPASVTAAPPDEVTQHLNQIAKTAYYEVMDGDAGILGILRNRETLTDAQLLALTPDDLESFYNAFVGPAVDRIEDAAANIAEWRNQNGYSA
jgi:hypothetical protein